MSVRIRIPGWRGPVGRLTATAAAVGLACAGLVSLAGPTRAVVETRPPLAYVADGGGMTPGGISVIDVASDRVVSTMNQVRNPGALALSPDGTLLYTDDAGEVYVIDTGSQAVKATLTLTDGAGALALNPAGTLLYVASYKEVTVIDTRTLTVTATVPVAAGPRGSMVLNPAGTALYVTGGIGSVAVVDTATDTVARTIPTGVSAAAMAVNASGSLLYVTDTSDNTVSVIDTGTGAVLATIPVGTQPSGISLNPTGTLAYVTNTGDDTVSVIDTAGDTVTATIPVSLSPVAVSFDATGSQAFVVDYDDNAVSVIDTATSTVSTTVSVGFYPVGIAVYEVPGGSCPCSLFPSGSVPGTPDSGDPYGVVLGVKVQASVAGNIDGVRFYKSAANTGTHTGSLWTADGTLLATGTFSGETATGWQTLMFASPVPVKPGVTYVASYYAPSGHYAFDSGYFATSGAGEAPITAQADGSGGGAGVYSYGGASAFPTAGYDASNYWVDVVFDTAGVPTAAPAVTATTPAAGAAGVSATTAVSASLSAKLDVSTLQFTVTDATGARVPGAVDYDATSNAATFTPGTQLPPGAELTASIQAADAWGHAMSSPYTWTFTTGTAPPAYSCPCSLFGSGATPRIENSGDTNSVEVGVRFTPAVDGTVTGVRFYKGSLNTGTHTGSLWGSDGTLLATGTFSDETAGGWQTLTFATPVAVTAGTTYVASYHAPNGDYSDTTDYFDYPYLSYPLAAPGGGNTPTNGVYAYGPSTTYPANAGPGTNYWTDVIFTTP